MACCAVDGEKLLDAEISDENRRKKSIHSSDGESRQSRGTTPARKTFTNECAAPASETTPTPNDKSLLMISDGELETLLQEASNPLYLKSSNNPLLQKVIDETNFDEPYLGPGHSLGKFPPIYKESRRHLERRLRQDAASCMASACTTQGGSLQNLSPTKHAAAAADCTKSKSLRKSGSLNTFPAGSDDTRELAALKSLLAASVAHKPPRAAASASAAAAPSGGRQKFLASQNSMSSLDDHHVMTTTTMGHKRNRSLSECPTNHESEQTPVQCHRKCSADPVLDSGSMRTELQPQPPPPPPIVVVDDDGGGNEDAVEEIEMMDIDHSGEEAARGEILPLLVKGAEDVTWSSSCVQRAFVEVSAPQKVREEADDKVSFPLALTRANDLQSNGQIYVDSGAYRPLLANKGFHNKLIFPMTDRRTAVSGFLESISSDAADGGRHSSETGADVQRIVSRPSDEDFKSSGYQRSLDENGNPFYPHDGGGGGMYRNASTFLHHDPNSNRAVGRKLKKTRQSSKQREMLAEQIEGHFGSLDIEVILKRINDSEDADDGETVPGGGGGGTARTTKRTLTKESAGGTGGGSNVGGGKTLKTKKLTNNNKQNLFENGLGNSKDDADSSASPVDSDDHPERSSFGNAGVRDKSSRLRKQEFQKKGPSSNENGIAAGRTSSSLTASLDGEAGNRDTKSPEPTTEPSRAICVRPDKPPMAVSAAANKVKDVGAVGPGDSTATKETGSELSSFVNDFYSTGVLATADEPEFHEVRKKKKRRQRSSFQTSSKGNGTGSSGGTQFYGVGASGAKIISCSHSDGDQGASDDFRRRRTQTSILNHPSADGSLRSGEVMLWPDLPHHRGNPFGADDVRRKSMGSVPPSDHSSGGDSDIESVHSLPVSSTTPKAAVGKTSSSSSCTPQASYADIAKMSGGSNPQSSRRTLSLSSSSSSATGTTTSHQPATTTLSLDAKRDAATCTTVDLCAAAAEGHQEDEEVQADAVQDGDSTSTATVDPASSSAEVLLLPTGDDYLSLPVNPSHPCSLVILAKSNPNPTMTTGDRVVVSTSSHHVQQTTMTTTTASSSSSRSSRSAAAGQPLPTKSVGASSRTRPVVVFAGDLASPLELAEVTFGFDINRQLLKESELGRRQAQQQQQQQQQQEQMSIAAAAVQPNVVESGVRFKTCGEDDDSIVSAGRIVDEDDVDDGGTENVAVVAAGSGRTVDASSEDEVRAFNYRNVVDYIGLAWNGVQREIEGESDRSGGGTPKVHFYERR